MSLGEIFVVEDDPAVRRTLSIVLKGAGYEVVCFSDGESLLATARQRYPVCVLLDVHLPGKSGLEILTELRNKNYAAPIFVISGQGTIGIAVQAMKDGALDFIEKPFRGKDLVDRLDAALKRVATNRTISRVELRNLPGRAALSNRESEVLTRTLLGKSTKDIGRFLSLSPRTVEDHRSNIRKKMGTKNLFELGRIASALRLSDEGAMDDQDKV